MEMTAVIYTDTFLLSKNVLNLWHEDELYDKLVFCVGS